MFQSQPNSVERHFTAEAILRDIESQPNWQARERHKRLQNLLHCLENDLPAPPNNEVCPSDVKPNMIAIVKKLMEGCEESFR